MVEQRRSIWTTFMSPSLWFDTWEEVLVELGFGRRKRTNEECEESIVFFDGQKDRIINLNMSDSSQDNTNGKRGGQPSFVFYLNEVGGGESRANTTSYSPTIITGSIASGDLLTLNFQLKNLAQTESGQKLSVGCFKYAKGCYGNFGHKE